LLLAGAPVTRSQEISESSKPTFSVNVNVVDVFVSVRDKQGNIVKDLAREDFTLREDGRKQTIKYFSRETGLPLTVGLIVDTTPSESNMLDEEKTASRVFLDKMLRPGQDRAFLIQFGYQVELLAGLTSSRERLAKSLDLLQLHTIQPPGSGLGSLMTVLADSIYLASDEIMEKQQGRKAFIVLGDGFHIGDRMEKAVAAAQRADSLIYTICIADKSFGGGSGQSEWAENLKILSRRTGGAFFAVNRKQTLEQIYGKIEEELRSQYSLGYTPDRTAGSAFRKIKIGVRRRGLVVRGREGYYPRSRP
jgi:VWFA-related protein